MSCKYKYIGKAMPRKDATDIVTGRVTYFDDIGIPGMLYGKVLRSPYAHANILNIDTRMAEKLPGVKAVLTHRNIPKDWVGGFPPLRPALDSKVRFVGDAVAVVAAESSEIAEEALELIRVKYEHLPAVYDIEEAIKPDAPQLYEEFPQNLLRVDIPIFGPQSASLHHLVMGDVDRGFAEADVVCQGSCAYDGLPNPLPPEPPGAIAKWENDKELIIWSATQSASFQGWVLQTKMGPVNIRSIGTHCGGSYGSKNFYPQICYYAAALAKVTRRPVKVYYTKSEHMGAFVLRPECRIHARVGLKRDGTVTAIDGEWIVGTGAYTNAGQPQVCVGLGEAQLAIRCENWNLKSKLVVTNRSPSGMVRGFGGLELKSALWPILSEAMEKADIDPLEFFKKNYVKAGDGYYWRDAAWWVCRGLDYTPAMEKGAAVFGWREKWKGWLKPTAVNGTKRIGVGIGMHGNADSGEDRSEAYVKLNPDGTAVIHCCVSEPGGGQRSSLCKMVAEVIQLPLENVKMTHADTLVNPFEFGLAGSRGTYAIGSAVIEAALDAKRKLLEIAARKFETAPENITTEDGLVFVKDRPESAIPWIAVLGPFTTCTGLGSYEDDFSVPNFMMQFVEVEVDMESGAVTLLQAVPATDVGQIIDPQALDGQIYGSLGAAGIDSALLEETVIDRRSGHILNANMIDYKWRTFLDLPKFTNVILESQSPTTLFKAVGVGEITGAPGPSAILMAVSNAISKRVHAYPLTPEKILKILNKIS
jgi:CO/xanthine dehydrogenase Mo-binding subunit